MKKIMLNDNWNLTMEDLTVDVESIDTVLDKANDWFECKLPCDIHMPLMEYGIIKDPVEALNCYNAEWTAQKSWWFKRELSISPSILENDVVELTFDALDCMADIFINGKHIAFHESAFYPFSEDVKEHLKGGINTLLVRLSTGLERVNEEDIEKIIPSVSNTYDELEQQRWDVRRLCLRKSQFVYGWDFLPKINTCGIVGDVYLIAYNKVAIRGLHVVTKEIADSCAVLEVIAELENLHVYKSFDTDLHIKILSEGDCCVDLIKNVHLRSGLNFLHYNIEVNSPKLWWPNGMGEQSLYTLSFSADTDGDCVPAEISFGIRTIELNMESLNERNRLFSITVNGVKTFCKGGNWVPADPIFPRISDEKYEFLIKEAKKANFTMLRVWGGGIYERNAFYDLCDRHGILVWQDFMFACAMYPDYIKKFCDLVEPELDYQTKRLRNHPSIALFCGNNENIWGFAGWWDNMTKQGIYGGKTLYNKLMPLYIEKNCTEIPYWNSSPYGGETPNGDQTGDCHYWHECTMHPDMEKRITPEEYDKLTSKFVSEYGYIGPCVKSTIEKYHAGTDVDRNGDIWKLHNNTFEKETVNAGIAKHYKDTENMSTDDYLLYASLCQGLMYQYSLESIRSKLNCWGSLFWMYNDSWGEIGWSIIDYYLKRKPSYYYVKRAFAFIKFILRESSEGVISVICVNESANDVELPVEFGYISFDGKQKHSDKKSVHLPAFSRFEGFTFNVGKYDSLSGMYFVKDLSEHAELTTLRKHVFRELKLERACVTVENVKHFGSYAEITLRAENFCHAVHFKGMEELNFSDLYFDMLPHETKAIILYDSPKNLQTTDIKIAAVN